MADHEPLWGPALRALRAAVTFVGHLALGLIVATGVWGVDHYFRWLWGQEEPKLFSRFPLRWLFDTSDLAIFLVFMIWGAIEAHRKLKG
jgi:hypothetical protein